MEDTGESRGLKLILWIFPLTVLIYIIVAVWMMPPCPNKGTKGPQEIKTP